MTHKNAFRSRRSRVRSLSAFLLGAFWTLLFFAALNAVSYFFRSDGFGDLVGARPQNAEAIGLPKEIWREPPHSRSEHIDGGALLFNIGVWLTVSVPGGLLVMVAFGVRLTNAIIRLSIRKYRHSSQQPRRLQFSLRTLMLLTAVVAVVVAGARRSVPLRRALLGTIYLCGPWIIVTASWLSRRLVAGHRRVVVYGTITLLLAATILLGLTLPGIDDFVRVLLGVYVCWVPQCVFFGALALLLVRVGLFRRCGGRR